MEGAKENLPTKFSRCVVCYDGVLNSTAAQSFKMSQSKVNGSEKKSAPPTPSMWFISKSKQKVLLNIYMRRCEF